MTRDDVIRMAKESAAECLLTLDSGLSVWRMSETELQHFAELIANVERERCAKVCDDIHAEAEKSIASHKKSIWVAVFMGQSMAARDCAAAIRGLK